MINTLTKFETGKTYKFSAARYREWADEVKLSNHRDDPRNRWIEECDGKVVQVFHSYRGFIYMFIVGPLWCEEVTVDRPKQYRFSKVLFWEDANRLGYEDLDLLKTMAIFDDAEIIPLNHEIGVDTNTGCPVHMDWCEEI